LTQARKLRAAYSSASASRPTSRPTKWAASASRSTTLAGIGVPTTLIWGRHDAATSLSVAEEAAARYGWPLRVIDGAGDEVALDRPAEFVDTLYSVLGQGEPRS
jgi:pimeloyl-ACP methyl ester carboxylesterase